MLNEPLTQEIVGIRYVVSAGVLQPIERIHFAFGIMVFRTIFEALDIFWALLSSLFGDIVFSLYRKFKIGIR